MFDRNQNSNNGSNMNEQPTSPNNRNDNLSSVNMVSEGTQIIGKLVTQSDIRIAGTVDGEAKVEGKIIIASSGHVEGNVNATNADIAGRVEGEVHVESKLTLRQSAVVECDIYTQSLVVEEGATFNGECHMRDINSPKNKRDVKEVSKPSSNDTLIKDGKDKATV